MTTILIKKKDTAGAPAPGDLTNAAGGAEIAVNTATKRLYTKDSGGTVVELGTNPSALTTNLLFSPDATYDIGASGATRPRDMFLSRNLTVGGTLTLAGGVNLNGNVTVGDSSADTLTINSTITSNLIFTDNTYDIGASGATRPRSGYFGTSLTAGTTIAAGGAIKSTGANLVNEASAIKISQEGVSTSSIFAYGTNASTTGVLQLVTKSSDGSVQLVAGSFAYASGLSLTHVLATAYSGSNAATWTNGLTLYNSATPATGVANLINFTGSSNVNTVFGVAQNASGYGDFVWAGYNGSFSELGRFTSAGNFLVGTTLAYAKLFVLGATSTPSLTVGTTATAVIAGASGQELAITESGTTPYAISLQARNSTGGPSGTSYPIALNPLGGNVGVGTTEPYGTASVFMGTTAPQDLLWYNSVNMIQIGESAARPLAGLFAKRSTYSGANAYNGDLMFYNLYYAGGADYQWKERMRIQANGYIGVNTTTPNAMLEIYPGNVSTVGTIASSGLMIGNYSSAGSLSQIGFGYTTGATNTTAYIALVETSGAAFAYGDLIFGTRSVSTDTLPTERVRITGAGNVGIGTSTPASASGVALVVHDTSTPRIRLTNNTTGQASSDGAELSLSGSDFYIENREAQNIVFYAGSERARIDPSGNLLVGTTTAVSGSNHIVVGSNSIQGFKKDFTNLGTTAQSFGFAAAGPGVYVCSMKSIGGASVAFLISVVFNNSGIDMYTTTLGNCTAGGNTGTITGINGDARIYTFTRNGGTGLFEVTASSTATGTTTFYMTPLNVFA